MEINLLMEDLSCLLSPIVVFNHGDFATIFTLTAFPSNMISSKKAKH